MKFKPKAIIAFLCFFILTAGCEKKDPIPKFAYPDYDETTQWPKLTTTQDLEEVGNVDVESMAEELEALQQRAGQLSR